MTNQQLDKINKRNETKHASKPSTPTSYWANKRKRSLSCTTTII